MTKEEFIDIDLDVKNVVKQMDDDDTSGYIYCRVKGLSSEDDTDTLNTSMVSGNPMQVADMIMELMENGCDESIVAAVLGYCEKNKEYRRFVKKCIKGMK